MGVVDVGLLGGIARHVSRDAALEGIIERIEDLCDSLEGGLRVFGGDRADH